MYIAVLCSSLILQRTDWLWVFFEKLRESKDRLVRGISKAVSFLVFPRFFGFLSFSQVSSKGRDCYIYNRMTTHKDPTLPQRTAQH
jgi:hypothetical protein